MNKAIGALLPLLVFLGGADVAAQQGTGSAPTGALGVDTLAFDRGVRPENDFYGFVNGSWLRTAEIPEDRSSIGIFVELDLQSEAALETILKEAAAGQLGSDADARRIGDLFRSFMDSTRVETLGLEPVRGHLARIAALGSHAELPAELARLGVLGVRVPFAFSVGPDPMDSGTNALSLSQGGLGLGDRDLYFLEGDRYDEIRAAYLDYVTRLLEIARTTDPAGGARRIVALERSLAEHHWTRTRNRDRNATYNPMSRSALAESAPIFGWDAHLAAAGYGAPERIIVRQPDFILAMDRLIAETPLEVWRDYLSFRLLSEAAPLLSSELVDAHFAFRGRVVQGLQENQARWRRGLGLVEEALGQPLGRLYVQRHFAADARERMQLLIDNLLQAFQVGIGDLEWMSPETKAAARDKLSKINVKIGHPDVWRDYSEMQIRPDDLFGNWERARRFQYQRGLERLGNPVDRNEWFMNPQTVNAYYNASNNEIVFPAAILQPPFFDPAADDAVNYGAIGAVIGHEISHGFDDQGRKSDGDGNLRDWWTGGDAVAFEERAEKLAAQYSSFSPLDGLNLNGRLTLGENIGDLSGVAVAYRAYRMSLGGDEAPVIAGFTGDQRFFLGWAQVWRTRYRPEALRQMVLTDPHSPAEYRVNGVLRNLPEFYRAFGVSEDHEMFVPAEQRVRVW